MTIDPRFLSKGIIVPENTNVGKNSLHYLVAIPLEDGRMVLAPTQGRLVHIGENDYGQVWAYLRYHRSPFYLVYSPSLGESDRGYVDTLGNVSEELRQLAEQDARETPVFDRRHIRIDEDFPTPGDSSDAADAYYQMLKDKGVFGFAGRRE